MPACRTGLENEGKSGTLLVGMLEMRKPLGESGSSNGGGDRATSEAHAAGLPINPAAKHASSSQVTAQPEQFDFRSGKEPADTDDGSHYLTDYPIREGHSKHEAGGGLREAAQGGGCAGVPGGCVPCGAQLPVRPTGKEPGTYVRFDERRDGLGNLGSLSKNAGSCRLAGLLHQRNQPQEWADYEDTPHRATPSTATRRSRSLPAGVHPVQEMGRRKQAQGPAPNPEVFAIHEHDSDEDKEKDHTPNSFSVVSPNHGEL